MPIDVSRIKAICFDVDGTLRDTDDQYVQKLVKWLTPVRFALPRRDVQRFARRLVMFTEGPGSWAISLTDRIGVDGRIIALGDRLFTIGNGKKSQPFQIISGVRDLLDNLRRRYPLCIISARGHKSTYEFLNQFELHPYFNAIATSQTCTHTKPYPDPVEWAAKVVDVPVTSCLMVGDTTVDIIAGKKAGAQTAGVLCGFGEKRELESAGADLILESTADLAGYLLDG